MTQPYLSLEAELHDAFWDAEDDGSEVRLLADFLKRHPGPALEMGAGSGRLMIPLLQKGLAVEGVELSPDMLALGSERAKKAKVVSLIHAGDMGTWDDGRKWASILAPAFTLQLGDDAEKILHHWHSLLQPGGALYLTVFMPYAELLGDLPEGEWYHDHGATLADGTHAVLETLHQLDHEVQRLTRQHRYTVYSDPPRTHESTQVIRWIEHSQMVDLLKRTGFRIEKFFLDFDPKRTTRDPDREDFDGILTYQAVRVM